MLHACSKAARHVVFERYLKKGSCMIVAILLTFVLSYPIFMLCMYFAAKMIFTPLDKVAAEQERELRTLLFRAKRVKQPNRLVHA
jgi:hypothetical protein